MTAARALEVSFTLAMRNIACAGAATCLVLALVAAPIVFAGACAFLAIGAFYAWVACHLQRRIDQILSEDFANAFGDWPHVAADADPQDAAEWLA
jgi:hypothetical protein